LSPNLITLSITSADERESLNINTEPVFFIEKRKNLASVYFFNGLE
jgi:hypothetical protein